jgi:hypothetical protein
MELDWNQTLGFVPNSFENQNQINFCFKVQFQLWGLKSFSLFLGGSLSFFMTFFFIFLFLQIIMFEKKL